jgi:ADP-heptose:LPS heptosyltransferase
MKKDLRILVSRTDRLGDVLLALPTLELLRQSLPEAEIDFLVEGQYLDVIRPYLSSRKIVGSARVVALRRWVKERQFTAALVLFPESAVLRSVWSAGISLRVGPRSKFWSFLLMNGSLPQHRSRAEKNEAEYNLDLARQLLNRTGAGGVSEVFSIVIPAEPTSQAKANEVLATLGIGASDPFVVIHPGMGGSALNLSVEQYFELSKALVEKGVMTLVSVGPLARDLETWNYLKARLPKLAGISGQPLTVIREIFRRARMVIAPSTGPLHLAHLVGTQTIGLYSPVRTQCAKRWAPWGGELRPVIFAPEVFCPGKKDCIGASCREFFCMDKFGWTKPIVNEALRMVIAK